MYCRKCGCNQWHSKEVKKERTIIKKPLWKGWLFFAIGFTPIIIIGIISNLLKTEENPWWVALIIAPCYGFIIASIFYFITRKKKIKETFIECTCIQCGYTEYTLKDPQNK